MNLRFDGGELADRSILYGGNDGSTAAAGQVNLEINSGTVGHYAFGGGRNSGTNNVNIAVNGGTIHNLIGAGHASDGNSIYTTSTRITLDGTAVRQASNSSIFGGGYAAAEPRPPTVPPSISKTAPAAISTAGLRLRRGFDRQRKRGLSDHLRRHLRRLPLRRRPRLRNRQQLLGDRHSGDHHLRRDVPELHLRRRLCLRRFRLGQHERHHHLRRQFCPEHLRRRTGQFRGGRQFIRDQRDHPDRRRERHCDRFQRRSRHQARRFGGRRRRSLGRRRTRSAPAGTHRKRGEPPHRRRKFPGTASAATAEPSPVSISYPPTFRRRSTGSARSNSAVPPRSSTPGRQPLRQGPTTRSTSPDAVRRPRRSGAAEAAVSASMPIRSSPSN